MLDDIFQKNLAALGSNGRNRFDPLTDEDIDIEFVAAETDFHYFVRQGEPIVLPQSQVDEANLPDPLKEELIFVIGMNSLPELAALIAKANPSTTFIVIEPNLALFQYALATQDFSPYGERVIFLAKRLDNIGNAVGELISSNLVLYSRNLRIYPTFYYRRYAAGIALQITKIISDRIVYHIRHLGNDFNDTLIGLTHDLKNIKYIDGAIDVDRIKDRFAGLPAVVVSAGPSLDKNIHLLPKLSGHALIIAVDTILNKLLKNGIIPDAVCSIERLQEVYDYFYRDTPTPTGVTLFVPPVVKPVLLETFPGQRAIAYRDTLPIYKWIAGITGTDKDTFLPLGSSAAHVAFGLAVHAGCSPIILVGQDLAFGQEGGKLIDHSKDTVYEDESAFIADELNRPGPEVDGYHGGKVVTSQIWLDFKTWFEDQISKRGLKVINATEGGARIAGTEQLALAEVAGRYGDTPGRDFQADFAALPRNTVDIKEVVRQLEGKIKNIRKIVKLTQKRQKVLKSLPIRPDASEKNLRAQWLEMQQTDKLVKEVLQEIFFYQTIHPNIVHIAQKVYAIPQQICYETIETNRALQLELCGVIIFAGESMLEVFEQAVAELSR